MNSRVILSIVLCASTQAALAQNCFHVTCGPDEDCSIAPSLLVAVLPGDLAIRSIGNHTRVATEGEAGLSKCHRVSRLPGSLSADRVSIYGTLLMSGTLRSTGVLSRWESNDGSELDFMPAKEVMQLGGKFFLENFNRIRLGEAQPSMQAVLPARLAKTECWSAEATVELSDINLVIGDNSAAGTYARRVRITQLGAVTKCAPGAK